MLKFAKMVAVSDIYGEQKDVITKTSNFNECAADIIGWLSDSGKRERKREEEREEERAMVVFSEL